MFCSEMKRLFATRRRILQFVGASPRTSLVALAIALGQLVDFFFDLPPELLQTLMVIAVALIGLFAKDEGNNGKTEDQQ